MFHPICFAHALTCAFYVPLNSITGFATRYKSLSKVIKKTLSVLIVYLWSLLILNLLFLCFSSGDLETSLLYVMHGAKSKRDGQGIWRDAKLIEKSMAGLGTRDAQLIYRFVLFLLLLAFFN